MHIPKGFLFNGTMTEIKTKNKFDLGLFLSDQPCSCAAMFTANAVKAAPVTVSNKHAAEHRDNVRAIIANSGCANACTGKKGMADAIQMCRQTAAGLKIKPEQVLVASTGVIGTFLPMNKIVPGINRLVKTATRSEQSFVNAVKSIMTTDTAMKTESRLINIAGKPVTILGCTKGAGMIKPELVNLPHATMLCFIMTDCAITHQLLKQSINESADESFNVITVDGDMSTNDTVFLLANGCANNKKITEPGKEYAKFHSAVKTVCVSLAKKMVVDGEGATKFVELQVINAASVDDARKAAAGIANSPLVKTAVFGADPNWGRILAAVGSVKWIKLDPDKTDVYFGNLCVCKNGKSTDYSEKQASKLLTEKNIVIKIDLHQGRARTTYYTCDLTFDYVKINSHYRT
jgi:glutamate N-acetyltransferase/amino-acid N-acetyltransferase